MIGKDWDDILSINLDGMFNVTRAFLDQLRATRGRIVNIGSIQSFVHVAWPNSAAYTTSKHGVLGFTRALAAELGKDGVRVNAIGPGLIETRINAEARAKNPDMVAKVMRPHAARPRRQARGYRRTGGVPRLRHVGLCYGLHHHGRRRLPHGLTASRTIEANAMQDRYLRTGIFLAPFHALDENPTLAIERDMELVEHLDRLNYHEAWIGEHHSGGFEIIACPEMFIAAAAQRTRHIRLGTGVVSLPYHHPVHARLAHDAARLHGARAGDVRRRAGLAGLRRRQDGPEGRRPAAQARTNRSTSSSS